MSDRETPSGIPIRPLYQPDEDAPAAAERLGKPGEFPYARGIYPDMYRGKTWT
ncbi:MAG: methylmalonyl-CoA mutase family protein, partial [Actinomycetota bacterium]